MKRPVLSLLLLLLATSANAAGVTSAGRWELHDGFWMSLHQTLMHDAASRTKRDVSALGPEQQSAWNAAVAAYRAAAGGGNITFAQPMMNLQNDLTQIADDAAILHLEGPLADALRQAAPVYRARWWAADRAANRFFLGYAAAMLRDAGEEIAATHETVYGARFPETIRVDVAPYAGEFGAYTNQLDHGGWTATVASRDPGNAGLAALEVILHESSHSLVGPRNGRVARAIAAAAAARGIDPPRDLWHAVLFATTSRLTKRALARRGADHYDPLSDDLLTRAWPQYRKPIETFWYPYLDGEGSLEEAIEKVVGLIQTSR